MPVSWHLTADCLSVVWFLQHWVQLVWNIDDAATACGTSADSHGCSDVHPHE